MQPADRGPSGLQWLIGAISLVLPWIGIPLALAGLMLGLRGDTSGWLMVAAGLALIVLDLLIDLYWARPRHLPTDEPHLNRLHHRCIGQVGEVVRAIVDGEGQIRIGGTLWNAVGPDCPAGTLVRVEGVEGTRLRVEPVKGAGGDTSRGTRPQPGE